MEGAWSGPLGVTFGGDQCVLRGASALINCRYDYPFMHIVTAVGWSKGQQISGNWELRSVPIFQSPPGRHRYVGNKGGDCRLQITDVQHADAGDYFFSFRTTLAQWTSETSTHLSVKGKCGNKSASKCLNHSSNFTLFSCDSELTAALEPSSVAEGDAVSLTCVSGCPTPVIIAWFRDGKPVRSGVFRARRGDAGRYHCAVWGQPRIRSAPVALNVMCKSEYD